MNKRKSNLNIDFSQKKKKISMHLLSAHVKKYSVCADMLVNYANKKQISLAKKICWIQKKVKFCSGSHVHVTYKGETSQNYGKLHVSIWLNIKTDIFAEHFYFNLSYWSVKAIFAWKFAILAYLFRQQHKMLSFGNFICT